MNDFAGRTTRNFRQDHRENGCFPNSAGYCNCPLELAPPDTAELVCSDIPGTDLHKPVIDIDLPVTLVESATPGHFHLYIDKAISREKYRAILRAMAEAEIVQWGYYDATVERGYGSLRHPDRLKKS